MENKLLAVVDDEKVFHLIVGMYIKQNNSSFKLNSFYNGEEIFNYLSDQNNPPPSLIFLDLNMPILNGWGFLEKYSEIQDQFNDLSIYLVTSSIDPEDKKKAESYDFVKGFVSKPLPVEFLKSLL